MASATAPPTPVSISSNTRLGAEPRSAITTLRASRKRASSPPEATFISGPGWVPGLGRTQNSMRAMPCGPAGAAVVERRRLGGRRHERGETRGSRIDQREVAGIAARQRRQIVDRRIVFASRRAQREQALLDPLEHARVLVGGGERLLEMPARLVERRERGVDRLDGLPGEIQ